MCLHLNFFRGFFLLLGWIYFFFQMPEECARSALDLLFKYYMTGLLSSATFKMKNVNEFERMGAHLE